MYQQVVYSLSARMWLHCRILCSLLGSCCNLTNGETKLQAHTQAFARQQTLRESFPPGTGGSTAKAWAEAYAVAIEQHPQGCTVLKEAYAMAYARWPRLLRELDTHRGHVDSRLLCREQWPLVGP